MTHATAMYRILLALLIALGLCSPVAADDPPTLPGALALWKFDSADQAKLTVVRNHVSANAHDDNLLPAPEQFFKQAYATGAPPYWLNSSLAVTDGGFTDPLGGTRASRIQWTNGGFSALQSNPNDSGTGAVLAAGTYTLSVYLKSNNGAARNFHFCFGADQGDTDQIISVPDTGVWTRFTHTFTLTGPTSIYNRVLLYTDSGTADTLIWGFKLNAGATATAYVPPDWEMRLGLGSTRPAWTSEGITADSGDIGIAFGQTYPTFAEQSGYMCVRIDDASASRISLRDIESYPANSPGFAAGTINSQGANRQGLDVASGLLRLISPVVDSKYHVIAWTWDGTTLKYYLDGTFLKQVAASTGWTSKGFLLGDTSVPFVGKRGPHALYTEAHTADEVKQMTDWIKSEMLTRSVTVNDLQTVIAFEGDSITELFGDWAAYSYTFQTLQGLTPVQHGVTNAVSGSSFVVDPEIDSVARTTAVDAILYPPKQYPIISVFTGTNDIAGAGRTAAEVFADYKAYCQARKAAGWHRVIAWTLLPRDVIGFEATRLSFNTMVRNASAEGWYDYLADVGADAELGDAANLGTYYPDGVHPNEDGHTILKTYATDAIEAVLAMPPADIGGGLQPSVQGGGFFGPGYFNYQIPADELSDLFHLTKKPLKRREVWNPLAI